MPGPEPWALEDSFASWRLAIALRRRLGVIWREFDPIDEAERCLWLGP